ncbi:hypothetical protein JX266_000026 [Neoarthrinium moseri]|nr:hypothetical protein JX266_000026 [Neoarthrinium moseri]
MTKSRLLYHALLIGLAATGSLAKAALHDDVNTPGSRAEEKVTEAARAVIWERVEYVVVEREVTPRRVILERIPVSTAPAEGAAPALRIPEPTAAPRKRQNDGQIQALSGEIQRLSISFSSVSSASQSISQSAQQVQQSADQAAREASQAISRTQSSATSAVAQASQQANDRIAQASSSFSSSMNSQISVNLASVQASASRAVSAAQAEASSSMASAVNVAMSQIQQAKAEATAVKGDATNFADQVQKNAVSTTNLAIIVAVSVSGAVILTSVMACLCLRYRRKRAARKAIDAYPDEKDYDKTVAVRGSPGTSRFNPFSGGTYPMDKLKLPVFSARSPKKPEPLNFGFAVSDYSDLKDKTTISTNEKKSESTGGPKDVYGVSPASFRLQKPPSVQNAETVRLIRVNSVKNKEQGTAKAAEAAPPMPQSQRPSPPDQGAPNAATTEQSAVSRKPVAVETEQRLRQDKGNAVVATPIAKPSRDNRPREPAAASEMDAKPAESKTRNTMTSEAGDMARASSRYTMFSTASTELDDPRESKRYTMTPDAAATATEEPGWRPPSSRASRALSTAQRLAFRDSDEPEPLPAPVPVPAPAPRAFSMASVSSLMRSDSIDATKQPTIPKIPRQGPSFAAFPTVRDGTPSMVNRPRPALVNRIREDAERRRRELEAKRRETRGSAEMFKVGLEG